MLTARMRLRSALEFEYTLAVGADSDSAHRWSECDMTWGHRREAWLIGALLAVYLVLAAVLPAAA